MKHLTLFSIFDSMLKQHRQWGRINQDLIDWFDDQSTHITVGGNENESMVFFYKREKTSL